MATHYIQNVVVTGTAENPQTFQYADLTDIDGEVLTGGYDTPPAVGIVGRDADRKVFRTEPPGVDSFKLALSDFGRMAGTVTVILKIVIAEEQPESDGYGVTPIRTMTGMLGILLEDRNDRRFQLRLKLKLLNTAQEQLMQLLTQHNIWPACLLFLTVTAVAQALDEDGIFNLKTLTRIPWRGAQGLHPELGVKLTDGKYCTLMSAWEARKIDRLNMTVGESDPRYRIQGTSIYVSPGDEDTTIDLLYLRAPATMIQGSPDTDCEFTDPLADVIIGLACKRFVDLTPMAARAYQDAVEFIEAERIAMPQTRSTEDGYDFFAPETGLGTWPAYDDSGLPS